MKPQKVFSIYDSKAEAYLQPWYARTTAEGMRSLGDHAAKDEGFKNHGADFTLFEIGEWDQESGVVQMYEAKRNLGTVMELMPQNKPTLAQ